MKIYYDNEVDVAYIQLSNDKPDGVVEVSDYINLDTTKKGKLVGIEVLNASKKFSVNSLFNYEVDRNLSNIKKKLNNPPVKTTGKPLRNKKTKVRI